MLQNPLAVLVAIAKDHLTRYEPLSGTDKVDKKEIQISGLTIDEASRRVYVHNKEMYLTAKEFELLTLLVKHPNRVFR